MAEGIIRANVVEDTLAELYAYLIAHPEKHVIYIGKDQGKWRALTSAVGEIEE